MTPTPTPREAGPTTLTFGKKSFTLHKMNLGAMRPRLADLKKCEVLSNLTGLPDADVVDALVRVVHAAAAQSQPGLSLEDFEAVVNAEDYDVAIQTLAEGFHLLATGSGMKEQRGGEAKSGEAPSP